MGFKRIFKYFLIWQTVILFIVSWSANLFPLRTTFIGGGEQASFANPKPYLRNPHLYFRGNFDGIHYIGVSRRGYGLSQQAFFPLYPKLMESIYKLTRNTVFNASLISTIFFLLALIYLAKLIRLDYPKSVAVWSITALLFFPVSFFFTAVYTESLFLFLCVSAFYYARKKRWWIAAILTALATYTRFVGIFLIPALLIELYYQTKQFRLVKLLPFLIMPLGLLAYMVYLQNTTGDPLAFIHVQASFGQGRSDKIILLYQVFWRYAKMLWTVNRADPLYMTLVFEASSAVVFFVMSLFLLIRYRFSYAFFNFCSLILPTLTGTFTSLPRYVLLCFPSFILIGHLLSKSRPAVRYLYLGLSLSVGILFLALFARGYWVA